MKNLACLLATPLVWALAFAAALVSSPLLFAAAVVLEVVSARRIERMGKPVLRALRGSWLGPAARSALFTGAFVLLLVRSGDSDVLTPLLCAAVPWLHGLLTFLALKVERRCAPLRLTRNIDLSSQRLPKEPGRVFALLAEPRFRYPESAAMFLGAVLLAGMPGRAVLTGFAACAAAYAAAVAVAAVRLRGSSHLADRAKVVERLRREVAALKPEVVLYQCGPAGSEYQVNMWLAAMENLGRPALVIVRRAATFRALAPTTLPVVCLRTGVDLMAFDLPTAQVVLYPANSSENSHMIRVPTARHVFVGHGDSDKIPSFNPYSRVYDEIWVAGRAGRDRYARAGIGVRDENIVEVGRPQLEGISTIPTGNAIFTVLYAPTWEGWNKQMNESSLQVMGEDIIRTLLAAGVRVIYKPHPLIGVRDPGIAAVHRRILAMIEAPNESVVGTSPTLMDCFNRSDMMISDVSSVVSDYVASRKPYAVANLKGRTEAEFRAEYPTASAAYLLNGDTRDLTAVLALARGDDPLAVARRELRTYLLGPDHPSAGERFRGAVDALIVRNGRAGGGEPLPFLPYETPERAQS